MSRFELSEIDQQKLSQMCKPCPFCASIFIYVGPMHALGYGVKCMNCYARTRNFDLPEYSTKRHIAQRLCWRAVQAWNTRAAETPTTIHDLVRCRRLIVAAAECGAFYPRVVERMSEALNTSVPVLWQFMEEARKQVKIMEEGVVHGSRDR